METIEQLTYSRKNDEQTLWQNVKKVGIIHRHPTQILRIINYGAYIEKEGEPTLKVSFSSLTNTVILNTHNLGGSTYPAFGIGYYSRMYLGQS
jgi:hypothetical protein